MGGRGGWGDGFRGVGGGVSGVKHIGERRIQKLFHIHKIACWSL